MYFIEMEKSRDTMDIKDRFEQIYKAYSKPMFLYALSFLISEEEAGRCDSRSVRKLLER